jgi:hypothetical protein
LVLRTGDQGRHRNSNQEARGSIQAGGDGCWMQKVEWRREARRGEKDWIMEVF